jgi:hypothetical protein
MQVWLHDKSGGGVAPMLIIGVVASLPVMSKDLLAKLFMVLLPNDSPVATGTLLAGY